MVMDICPFLNNRSRAGDLPHGYCSLGWGWCTMYLSPTDIDCDMNLRIDCRTISRPVPIDIYMAIAAEMGWP